MSGAFGALRTLDVCCCSCGERMRLGPKLCRNGQWIDSLAFPPGALVAAPVQLTMVQPADRNGEAVAHFPPHRPLLRELDVMGIRGGAAADKARLSDDKSQMVAIAFADRFANDSDFLRGPFGALPSEVTFICFVTPRQRLRHGLVKRGQPCRKGGFDCLCISG